MEIRYHHLLCIPRFIGEGYSDDFCQNMQDVKKRFESEEITLVEHCDEVCKNCPNNSDGKCTEQSKVGEYDRLVKELLQDGKRLSPSLVCPDCKWYYICQNAPESDLSISVMLHEPKADVYIFGQTVKRHEILF